MRRFSTRSSSHVTRGAGVPAPRCAARARASGPSRSRVWSACSSSPCSTAIRVEVGLAAVAEEVGADPRRDAAPDLRRVRLARAREHELVEADVGLDRAAAGRPSAPPRPSARPPSRARRSPRRPSARAPSVKLNRSSVRRIGISTSCTSSSETPSTTAPRYGYETTSPSCSSCRSASRTGPRLVFSSRAIRSSIRRSPSSSSPTMIASRSASTTCSRRGLRVASGDRAGRRIGCGCTQRYC